MTSYDADGTIDRLREAVDDVKREVRGMSQAQAEERLRRSLRTHGAFLDPGPLSVLAWNLRDPWAPLRHPLRHRREVKGLFATPDPGAASFEAEVRRVEHLLHRVPEVRESRSARTLDGNEHVVTIDPYSDELAERVRRLVHPTPVRVIAPGES